MHDCMASEWHKWDFNPWLSVTEAYALSLSMMPSYRKMGLSLRELTTVYLGSQGYLTKPIRKPYKIASY